MLDRLDKLEEGDEVEEIVERFEDVAHSLAEARNQLQAYADNLRGMVEVRTEALSRGASERRADIGPLRAIARRHARHPYARQTVALRAAADSPAFLHPPHRLSTCTFASRRHYVWPETETPPALPEHLTPLLTEGRVRVFGERIFVPVEAQEGATEGTAVPWLGYP